MTRGTERADVVVAGAGLAGLTAAVAAAEAGARVVVVEKQPGAGGSTVLSGGFFAFAGTDLQRAHGITDSSELLERELLEVGEHRNDAQLVAAYATGQLALYEWLGERGLVVEDVEASSGQSVARSHRADPAALVAALAARAGRLGVDIRYETPVRSLLLDGDRVHGVVTDAAEIDASGVVLACGGFTRSDELMQRWAPSQSRALRVAGRGNTGDGIALGTSAGAGLRDMEYVKGTFGTHPDTGPDEHELLLLYYLGAVIVNRRGHRYVDESISYKLLGDACLEEDDPVSFQVFDATVFESCPNHVPLFDPRPYLESGLLLRGDTLEALAAAMQVPADSLRRTIADYNGAAERGGDEVGRTSLVHGGGALVPLDTPPFYAYPSTSVVIATYCGLTIDSASRVLRPDGTVVPGLWAAGEVTGGFHGAAYMTGSSLGKAAFFGRAAGRDAAAAAVGRAVGRISRHDAPR